MEAIAAPLLRNDQVVEMQDEARVLEKKLVNPAIEDKGAVRDQLMRVQRQLETQRPRSYASEEVDAAVKREAELRAEIQMGMLSHEEMRKALRDRSTGMCSGSARTSRRSRSGRTSKGG
jgi:hypothetical protein